MSSSRFVSTRAASIKTLDLLAEPGERLYAALDAHLQTGYLKFVQELEACLNLMSRRGLLGSVTYSGRRDENCQFTYFRAKAVCEFQSESARVIASYSTYPVQKNGQWWKNNIQVVELLKKGVITIQHVLAHAPVERCQADAASRLAAAAAGTNSGRRPRHAAVS